MVNSKKMHLAYKRYVKNFFGSNAVNEYEEGKNEIVEVIDINDTERDHILLIDMDNISSFWLDVWKNDVLIKNGRNVSALKKSNK